MPSISQPRKHCAAVFLDGMVYVAGGIGVDGQDLTLVEKYDPSASKWATVASLNECKGEQPFCGHLEVTCYCCNG